MIDLQTEHTLPLGHARHLDWLKGRGGQKLSIDSLRRWALRGLRGVVLETTRIGGTLYTSTEAVLRFLARINDERGPARPATERRRAIEVADRKLDDAGIK